MPEEKSPKKPEAGSAVASGSAKAETVTGPGPKISVVDRSVLAEDTPELSRQQMQTLRSKLQNKFH